MPDHKRPLIPMARIFIPAAIFLITVLILIKIFPLISDLVVVLVIAVVLNYVFRPWMAALERLGMQRVPAILTIFALVGSVVTGFVLIMSPIIGHEVSSLTENIIPSSEIISDSSHTLVQDTTKADFAAIEDLYIKVTDWLNKNVPGFSSISTLQTGSEGATQFASKITSYLGTFIGQSTKILSKAVNIFALSTVVPFFVFFFLKDGDKAVKMLIEKVPNRYFEMFMSLVYMVNLQLGNYITSILLESLIIAALSWPSLALLGVRFSLVLAIINGLLNMIPFFGPLIAFFPLAIVVLITGGGFGMLFGMVIILVLVQAVDNILLKPILISRSVSVHPVTVLLAVLIGGRVAGPIGMFVAVPVFAVIQVIIVDSYVHLKDYKII